MSNQNDPITVKAPTNSRPLYRIVVGCAGLFVVLLLVAGISGYMLFSPPVILLHSSRDNSLQFHQLRLTLEYSFTPPSREALREIHNAPKDLANARLAAASDDIPLVVTVTPPSANDNAVTLYGKWRSLGDSQTPAFDLKYHLTPMSLRYKYTPSEIATMQKFFDENATSQSALLAATDKPYFYAPSETDIFTEPYDLRFDAALEIRDRSVLLTYGGHNQAAIDMQCRDFLIANQIAQAKGMWALNSAEDPETTALFGLQGILTHEPPNPDDSFAIIRAVESQVGRFSLAPEMRVEIANSLAEMASGEPKMLLDPEGKPYASDDREFITDLTDEAYARQINHLRVVIDQSGEPPDQRRLDWIADDNAALGVGVLGNVVTELGGFVPYGWVAIKFDTMKAREQVLLAGATVLAVKAKTGEYPGSLPGKFVDPFGGKQLQYRHDAKGFTISSLGPSAALLDEENTFGFPETASEVKATFVYPAPPQIPVDSKLLRRWGYTGKN